jgi:hypothetical protein
MIVSFFVLSSFFFMGIGGMNFGQRFLIFVFFLVPVFFFVVPFVVKLSLLGLGVAGGFKFFVAFFIVFVEFSAANLRYRFDFDAVLRLFVLGFDKSGRKGGNLVIAQVFTSDFRCCGFGSGRIGYSPLVVFRSRRFAFRAGIGQEPTGQTAREAARPGNRRSS